MFAPVRRFAYMFDFESLGHRAVELVAGRGVTSTHISQNRTSVMFTSYGSQKKKTRQTKGAAWGKTRITHVFPHQDFPVKHHHRAWLGGYVYSGQLGVQTIQAPVREG